MTDESLINRLAELGRERNVRMNELSREGVVDVYGHEDVLALTEQWAIVYEQVHGRRPVMSTTKPVGKVGRALGVGRVDQLAKAEKKALKRRRRMTVGGVVVGGLVAGPIGAVALAVTENVLNTPDVDAATEARRTAE